LVVANLADTLVAVDRLALLPDTVAGITGDEALWSRIE
jgi:hypothetical protein